MGHAYDGEWQRELEHPRQRGQCLQRPGSEKDMGVIVQKAKNGNGKQ